MTQTPPEPVPPSNPGAEHRTTDRRTGRLLVGSGMFNLILAVIVIMLLLIIAQVTAVNGSLALALTQQRDQFQTCKSKPVGTRGCTQPVAAEPSVIVKEGTRGLPGGIGPQGLQGPQGPEGPAGPQGPAGPPGAQGKTGPPPGCALLASACIGSPGVPGKDGVDGQDGKDGLPGKDGQDGKDGVTPPCLSEAAQCRGADGKDGAMGAQGQPGNSVSSTQCVDDDTPTGSHWLIVYKDGAQETSPGPCRLDVP
jgi:hypothetical protein